MTFFADEYGNSMAIAVLFAVFSRSHNSEKCGSEYGIAVLFAVFGSVIKNLLCNPKTDIK